MKPIKKPSLTNEMIRNSLQKPAQSADILPAPLNPPLQNITKKKQYKQFYKLVKAGKFTTAILSAKTIGVTRQTIGEWLDTPIIQKALQEDVDEYVRKIKTSQDWKASAYLLDKVTDKDTNAASQTPNLKQLIVINTT